MTELLDNFWFLLFGFLTITSVVSSVAHAWRKVREAELQAALKRDMIQAGMPADDILKVLQGRSIKSSREEIKTSDRCE
jgi:hypothetical protein